MFGEEIILLFFVLLDVAVSWKFYPKMRKISGSEGWWTGRLLDSESVGVFPANFVACSEPDLRIIDYKDLQIGDLIGVGGFG